MSSYAQSIFIYECTWNKIILHIYDKKSRVRVLQYMGPGLEKVLFFQQVQYILQVLFISAEPVFK